MYKLYKYTMSYSATEWLQEQKRRVEVAAKKVVDRERIESKRRERAQLDYANRAKIKAEQELARYKVKSEKAYLDKLAAKRAERISYYKLQDERLKQQKLLRKDSELSRKKLELVRKEQELNRREKVIKLREEEIKRREGKEKEFKVKKIPKALPKIPVKVSGFTKASLEEKKQKILGDEFENRIFKATFGMKGKVMQSELLPNDPVIVALDKLKYIMTEVLTPEQQAHPEFDYPVVDKQMEIIKDILIESTKTRHVYVSYYDTHRATSTYFKLNDHTTVHAIETIINGYLRRENKELKGSDPFVGFIMNPITNVKYWEYVNKPVIGGELFPYFNKTDIDLRRYQIISNESEMSLCDSHCLVYALKMLDVDVTLLENKSVGIIYGKYPRKNMKLISNVIKRDIKLMSLKRDGKQFATIFKADVSEYPQIELALYDNHYFVYDNSTKYTKIASNGKQTKSLSSLGMIRDLNIRGMFTPSDKFHNNAHYNSTTTKIYNINTEHQKEFDINVYPDSNICDCDECNYHFDNYESRAKERYICVCKKCKLGGFSDLSFFEKPIILYADSEACFTTLQKNEGAPKLGGEGENEYKVHTLMYLEAHSEGGHVFKDYSKFQDLLRGIKNKYGINGSAGFIMYFHNLKYDWRLIRQDNYLHIVDIKHRDNQIYEVTVRYNGMMIKLRDSYKYLSVPLSSFKNMFGLESGKKELIIYSLYTNENKDKSNVSVRPWGGKQNYESCMEVTNKGFAQCEPKKDVNYFMFDNRILISSEDAKLISQQCDFPLFSPEFNTYQHSNHMKYYLSHDCATLRAGMIKFGSDIKNKFELDIHKSLTLSSLSHKICIKRGVYDGTFLVCGTLQDYINTALVGGRCCTKNNTKHIIKDRDVNDLDANSLYPSAMARLDRYPKGPAKKFDIENAHIVSTTATYYIVTVRALCDTKEQQIPFPANIVECVDANGKIIKKKLNTNLVKGDIFTIDKYTLEDWVKFSGFQCEFIEGIYWDEGLVEGSIGRLVTDIYTLRAKARAEGNDALQNVYKLILNTMYGKTILKRSTEKTKCMNLYKYNKDNKVVSMPCDDFFWNNMGIVRGYEIYGNTVEFTCDTYDYSHYNLAHIGCQVLSMSKRIMNEVMDIADRNNIDIFYQDTDSMHIPNDKCQIKLLANEFKNTYNKELIGSNLGQFSSDFKLGDCKDVVATKTIILGKKSYLDVLRGVDKKTGKIQTGYHIRMKGVNEVALSMFDPEDLYERLYKGELINFDLAAKGKLCIAELYTSHGNDNDFSDKDTRTTVMYSKSKFIRSVSFPDVQLRRINKK